MTTTSFLVGVVSLAGVLAGCSKEPDNAFTRYGEWLAQSERRAKETADRANAAIARQQEQMKQESQAAGQ